MLDARKRSELDQASAGLLEFVVPLWANMYKRLIQEGVPAVAAIEFVKAFILKPSDPRLPDQE